jgi:anti-sigma-K factor RskA
VLESLDPAERARTETALLDHLPGCAECSAFMNELREVSGELALAADPVSVPDAMTERVMAAVRGESHQRRERVISHRRAMVVRLGTVAAAAALIASLAWNAALVGRARTADRRSAAMARATSLLADPSTRTIALSGGRGSLSLLFAADGRAALVGNRVPDAPNGRIYELWFLDGSTATPVTTFHPSAGVVAVDLSVSGHQGIAITVERSFVSSPTTQPLYKGTIA